VFSFGVHNIIIMVVQKMKQKKFFFRQNTHQIIVWEKNELFFSLYISTTNNNCFLMFFFQFSTLLILYIRKLKYIIQDWSLQIHVCWVSSGWCCLLVTAGYYFKYSVCCKSIAKKNTVSTTLVSSFSSLSFCFVVVGIFS